MFFKDLIDNFSLKGSKENVEILKDVPVFRLKENIFGIWANLNFLKEFEKFLKFLIFKIAIVKLNFV